jgi:hypothetical protein
MQKRIVFQGKDKKNISAQSVYWQANCITADEKEKKRNLQNQK